MERAGSLAAAGSHAESRVPCPPARSRPPCSANGPPRRGRTRRQQRQPTRHPRYSRIARGEQMTETLDSALKARLRAVLDGQPVTEAELRTLSEQADACSLILSGLLAHAKRRLERLSANPT